MVMNHIILHLPVLNLTYHCPLSSFFSAMFARAPKKMGQASLFGSGAFGKLFTTKKGSKFPTPKPRAVPKIVDPSAATSAGIANLNVATASAARDNPPPPVVVDLEVDNASPQQLQLPRARSAVKKSCTGVIPLNDRYVNDLLDWFFKYGPKNVPGRAFCFELVGTSPQANAYSTKCTDQGIPRNTRYHPGNRCNECQQCWTLKGDYIKGMLKKRATRFKVVARVILLPSITDEDAVALKRFALTKDADLGPDGIKLRDKAKNLRDFYLEAKVNQSGFVIAFLMMSHNHSLTFPLVLLSLLYDSEY